MCATCITNSLRHYEVEAKRAFELGSLPKAIEMMNLFRNFCSIRKRFTFDGVYINVKRRDSVNFVVFYALYDEKEKKSG